MAEYKIVASPAFKLCLNRLAHFLQTKYSAELAQKSRQAIKIAIQENLEYQPHIAPISDRLIDLGVKDFRQYNIDVHNIVFYRVNEDKKQVVLLAVMDARQSIQKLLTEIVLLL